MGTITQRELKDGTIKFRAQVRVKRKDLPDFHESRTFSKKSLATEWIKRRESEIERDPQGILNPAEPAKKESLEKMIHRYLSDTEDQGFARTKVSSLLHICTFDIAKKDVFTLTRQDFSDFALIRRKGDPIMLRDPVAPSTVLKDFSHISAVFAHADYVWGEPIHLAALEMAYSLKGLKKSRIVTKSRVSDRLPTSEELQALTILFYKNWRRVRTAIPMHLFMWLAIYSGRREDEMTRLMLKDWDQVNTQWLVRDVKDPDGSKGNHKYFHTEPLCIEIINEIMQPEVRNRVITTEAEAKYLIPINSRTVSSYFTRGCKMLGIEGLRFHDLRHEAATRYAEDGFTIPQLQTITMHESWSSLKRYVNLKKRGSRLDWHDAMDIAEESYNSYFKEHSKTQRYLSKTDIEAGIIIVDKRRKENHHLRQHPPGRKPKLRDGD